MIDQSDHVLVCPKNDEESVLILKLAETFGIATVVSGQPHGAKLANEKNLIDRIRALNGRIRAVVIVEIPGPAEEKALREEGIVVTIIDHHLYPNLNRMQKLSSLEQFLLYFGITDEDLIRTNYDPVLVRGVGMIDRGYFWELEKEGLVPEDRTRVIEYYGQLGRELGDRTEQWGEALKAWESRRIEFGVLIVRAPNTTVKIREEISFLVAQEYPSYPPPITIIEEGEIRIIVQEFDNAKVLYDRWGGFMFGQGRCWGLEGADRPLVAEIFELINENL